MRTLAPPPQNWVTPPPVRSGPNAIYALTKSAQHWLLSLTTALDATPRRFPAVTLTGQSAAISTTPLPLGTLAAGIYRVGWYARVTTPATTASSLTVTIAWTESAVSLTASGAALTGNSTTTVQGTDLIVRIDAASPISYSTAYSSTGATAMIYRLDVVLEQVA